MLRIGEYNKMKVDRGINLNIRTLKKPIRVFSGTSKPFIIQNESIKV